jgi:hypothetical protein
MRTVFMSLAFVFGAACSDDGGSSNLPKDAAVDAAVTPDAPCFSGTPTTHEEIINACTTAQKLYKDSKPPLLDADGTLPPLPP